LPLSDEEITNEHPRSEQWLFVISGSGTPTVAPLREYPRTKKIKAGSLVVVERRERHQIKNNGRTPPKTLNIYVPPAYAAQGEVKATANRHKQ
jgi:mannose-6-phosphate isomerase-like protein (cupin superfamily)